LLLMGASLGDTGIPKKKKDQLSLAQYWDNYPANRPDPDCPGGLGAEESGAERTGPTQDLFVAIHKGGRWAEVGQYYDSANDPVTAWMGDCAPGFREPKAQPAIGARIQLPHPLAAARGWRDHVG
jgi:hypothetical protein